MNYFDIDLAYNRTILTPVVVKRDGINVLGLLLFCVIFGILISRLKERAAILKQFFEAMLEVVMQLVRIAMLYSPIGIFFLIVAKILEMADLRDFVGSLGALHAHRSSRSTDPRAHSSASDSIHYHAHQQFQVHTRHESSVGHGLRHGQFVGHTTGHLPLRRGEQSYRSTSLAFRSTRGRDREHGRNSTVRSRGSHLHCSTQWNTLECRENHRHQVRTPLSLVCLIRTTITFHDHLV